MDDYRIAQAQYALWEAEHCGTPAEQMRALSHLNQLLAEAIHGPEVTE